jgi:hypothetical protein
LKKYGRSRSLEDFLDQEEEDANANNNNNNTHGATGGIQTQKSAEEVKVETKTIRDVVSPLNAIHFLCIV